MLDFHVKRNSHFKNKKQFAEVFLLRLSETNAKKIWTVEEVTAMYKAFPNYMAAKKLPSMKVILEQQELYKDLRSRSWQNIRGWLSNEYRKL